MTGRQTQPRLHLTITCAFALAIVSCVMGLFVCFVKSPQARSADYLAMSQQASVNNPALAFSAALEAARLYPGSPAVWHRLSQTLQDKGDFSAAQKARVIALRLHKNPDDLSPVYAMPAELKLSLLASSNGDL